MSDSYDELAGKEMDVANHPDNSHTFNERFPAPALNIGLNKSPGPSIDDAFSNVNSEYPLGNALRAKAKTMR